MAKPDNVARFFLYLDHLRQGGDLSFEFWSTPRFVGVREVPRVAQRQFLDDVAYLKELLPQWNPGTDLTLVREGAYGLVRTAGEGRLEESEFLPFLEALVNTTNLFPFGGLGWLKALKQTEHPDLRALAGRIVYTSTPHPDKLKAEPFRVLAKSLVTQRRVTLTYRNPQGVDRQVEFEPLAFLNQNGVWYLVGDGEFAHRPRPLAQPTQLKLSRVRRCVLGDQPFEHRFDLGQTLERLKSTYGAHLILGDSLEPQTVILRFYGEAVGHIDESWFHQGQIKTRKADGTLDLTLKVNDPFDALQLCGQWGTLCRPVAPPELVATWKQRCRDLVAWAEEEDLNGQKVVKGWKLTQVS